MLPLRAELLQKEKELNVLYRRRRWVSKAVNEMRLFPHMLDEVDKDIGHVTADIGHLTPRVVVEFEEFMVNRQGW